VILESLTTRNFRNLLDREHQFHPLANVLLGENGQGKTNLLEAIYFLATTKSFRTTRTGNVIRLGTREVFAQGNCQEESIRRSLSAGLLGADERKRRLLVNGQKLPLHDYLQVLPVFAYSSARLEIIRGGPEERRRFLDRGIATLRVPYLQELSRYARVLRQRNALIQRVHDGTEQKGSLDAWDEELAVAGAPIIAARESYVRDLEKTLHQPLAAHSAAFRDLRLSYRPAGITADPETSRTPMRQMRSREVAAGFSLVGPHRDVLEFTVRGVPAAEILSSGEIKMLTLLLKLGKMQLYGDLVRRSPVFLLDDIDAELDLGVMQRLLSSLLSFGQFFTTSAKESVFRLLEVGPHRRFLVREGGIVPMGEA
jgi:DNA replication and repair protein RecF